MWTFLRVVATQIKFNVNNANLLSFQVLSPIGMIWTPCSFVDHTVRRSGWFTSFPQNSNQPVGLWLGWLEHHGLEPGKVACVDGLALQEQNCLDNPAWTNGLLFAYLDPFTDGVICYLSTLFSIPQFLLLLQPSFLATSQSIQRKNKQSLALCTGSHLLTLFPASNKDTIITLA
jgi:hypothetical protein